MIRPDLNKSAAPAISIIVPVYNNQDTVGICLESIYSAAAGFSFEVIVVDDASTDKSAEIARQYPCGYFKIKKSGAAAARNFGIKAAKGGIILFFDADVKLNKDTIGKFLKHFREDKDAYIIQGRWSEKPPIPTFSSRFQLLKYAYNFKGLFKGSRRVEAANLETGCLGLRAEVFNYFKGFDEGYKFSGGEEHEFGIRLLKKYRIYYYSDIFVEHAFSNIFRTLSKVYKRTVNFSMLAFKTKSGDFVNRHRNSVPTRDKINVVIAFLALISSFLFIFNARPALIALAALLISYILNMFGFFIFLTRKEDIFFAARGIAANFLMVFPILFGLLKGARVFYISGRKDFKL